MTENKTTEILVSQTARAITELAFLETPEFKKELEDILTTVIAQAKRDERESIALWFEGLDLGAVYDGENIARVIRRLSPQHERPEEDDSDSGSSGKV